MIGTRLGNRYEIIGELGRGGMGVVYRARDPLLNREVAVKLVPPMLLTKQSEERFSREAQTVAQMDHPAIVPIYDIGQHEGSMYFLMPVVRGTNLRAFISEKPRSLGEILDIAIQTAEGLEYSHARGVIHRDIKPENIMVSEEEDSLRVRIMDFGLAKATSDQRLTRTGTLIGTVAYFSPEQVASGSIDHRSDIYALGVVLYEALSGETPFTGEVQSILYRIVHEIPRPLGGIGGSVGDELDALIQKAIVKDPARRYQTAGEMAEALRRYRANMQESERGKSIILSTLLTAQIHRPVVASFIGREKEIAELQKRLSAALDGECQFAVIAGEPGIGKTRLVGEIENLARARKIRVLHGRFLEQDRTFAYQGFCEVVQEFFRSGESSMSGELPDFNDLALDLVTLFPVLSEISEIRAAANLDTSSTSAEGRKVDDRTYIFEILARTLGRIGGGKPLVLIFENLHSAELSLDALQYVARRLGPTPTLIIGTFRQTEVDRRHPLMKLLDGFSGDPRFAALTLGPFSPSEHRKFLETIVGSPELASGLAERLYEATDANPFFTKELVRSLIDSGGIARAESGQWTLSGEMAIASDALPATIQQTVERRIERLPEELREILSIASVIGRSFEFRELESLTEGKGDLDDVVDRLVYEGLIEEERESRGDRLAFSSGIVRDVLYGALSRRKRKSLHRRYAELLEKRNLGRLDRVYPQLVLHFSEGDVPEKTVEYGLVLAKRSIDAFSSEEAAQTLRSVIEFLEDDEWTPPPGTEAEARTLLAGALRQLGQIDGALREAEAAVRLFTTEKQSGRAAEAMLMAAETAWQGRRIEEARRWLEQGIETARAASEHDTLVGLLSMGATVANLRGEYAKAKEYLDEIEKIRPEKAVDSRQDTIPTGGRLVVALSNPAPATAPGDIALVEETETLGLVFERLVSTDDQGHLIGALCEEWEVLEGGRSLRLKLRNGISFHDGTPLTAQEVKASFEHAVRHYRRERAAYAAIEGFAEFRDGAREEMTGIVVLSDRDLEIRLHEPLPIYPAMLTDVATGIARPSTGGMMAGTGPFQIAEHSPERIVMEKNPGYRFAGRPRLDSIEFKVYRNASSIATALRSGEVDMARDLVPQDLDELLRDPRFRGGLQEAAKKITYFAIFNHTSAIGGNEAVRRALCGVIPVNDLVWRTLGRLAQPATSLIPPGLVGHDPGRRRQVLTREQAIELLDGAGIPRPTVIRAAVHPLYQDRYRALAAEMFEIWKGIGVEVEIATDTMESFMASYAANAAIDLRVMRWSADYDDGDDFSYGLFHSHNGRLSRYLSSPEIDALVEEARAERRPAARELVYRRFESAIGDAGSVLPLFHEIDYRLAGPFIRGMLLRSTPPFVNYGEVGKGAAPGGSTATRASGGVLAIPIGGDLSNLEPTHSTTIEMAEVTPIIFEPLTRFVEGARIVPWLASSVEGEDGARRFRIRLREDVRFHDGRRLTARDVRYTFERMMTMPEAPSSGRYFFASIKGAVPLIEGKARELAGLHIISSHELVIELERPLSFFPTLLSHTTASIVPEGLPDSPRTAKEFIGTGPFRIVSFEPGVQLQTERNPLYWRDGYPKSEGLLFRFNMSSEQIREEFKAGRLSVASDLQPSDVEALRRDPLFGGGYKELPRLSTYYAALNRHSGPLADPDLRRRLIGDIDIAPLVRTHLGRLGIPARGIIPPGLLGSVHAGTRSGAVAVARTKPTEQLELTAAVHPVYFEQYAAFGRELMQLFADRGVQIKVISRTMDEWMEHRTKRDTDLIIGRWSGDYPDADTFASGIVHTQVGSVGRYVGSPAIDHLIESGQEESDPAIRHTIYQEIEQTLAREALILPFFHEQICRISRPEVEGLSLNFNFPEVKYEELRMRR